MLSDEQIELFAIRAAKGNNGGKWSEHYTDDQKDYWRRFVRDLAGSIRGVQDGDLSPDEILASTSADIDTLGDNGGAASDGGL